MPQHPEGILKGTFESLAISMLAFAHLAEDISENLFPEQIEEPFGCSNAEEIIAEYIKNAAHYVSEKPREEILELINHYYKDT